MIEPLWDVYTQVMATLFASALSVYCFRLSGFFAKGTFHRSFRLLGPAFAIYAFGSFADLLPLLTLVPESFHMVHFVAYAVFFSMTMRSIYLFYQTWKTMGMGRV